MPEPALKKPKMNTGTNKTIVLPKIPFTVEVVLCVGFLRILHRSSIDLKFIDPNDYRAANKKENEVVVGLGNQFDLMSDVYDWNRPSNFDLYYPIQNNQETNYQNEFFYNKRLHKNNDKGQKTTLSCVGLIYKYYGKRIIQSIIDDSENDVKILASDMNMLFDRIYFDFIEVIDATFTNSNKWCYKYKSPHPKESAEFIAKRDLKFSINNWNFDSIIEFMNPDFVDAFDSDLYQSQFFKATDLSMGIFIRFVKYLAFTHLSGKSIIENAYNEMISGSNVPNSLSLDQLDKCALKRILILNKFVSWKEHLHTYEYRTPGLILGNCLYVVFPDSTNGWRVSCVPTSPGALKSRQPFPASWRGLVDQDLANITKIDKVKFVHSQGFIAGGENLESCLRLAIKAVNEQN